jgi:hypothetical protein
VVTHTLRRPHRKMSASFKQTAPETTSTLLTRFQTRSSGRSPALK